MSVPLTLTRCLVFWIHHCQIDRLFAIWQKIHPDSWFAKNDGDTNAEKIAEAWYDPERVLSPFRTSQKGENKQYWTANASRKLDPFGYDYPETFSEKNPLELWRDSYNWSWRPDGVKEYGKCPDDMQPRNMSEAQVYQFTDVVIEAFDSDHPGEGPSDEVLSCRVASDAVPEIEPVQAVAQASVKAAIIPSDKSFTNIPAEDASKTSDDDVDESQVSRSWYVDMLVGR
jgi:hypothetical protein